MGDFRNTGVMKRATDRFTMTISICYYAV